MVAMKVSLGIFVLASALALPAFSQRRSVISDPWTNLSRITHKHTYWVETRDGKCVSGVIQSVTAKELTMDALSVRGDLARPDVCTRRCSAGHEWKVRGEDLLQRPQLLDGRALGAN